ncbi:MAG: UDP-N-acetylglucosamine 4,6-dehydratase (inverting) [Solirubrobacteraceae bacterium]
MRDFHARTDDLDGASILVTGGTGSFGHRFIRHVLDEYEPRRLIVFSRDELKQHEMSQEFSEARFPCMRYFIGDVRDADRLRLAMREVDYVIHAAALKQVPTAEYNPFECIKTNVYGAENVVAAALATGVKRVIALSTDKAANPINLYGASKLASDKIFIAANNLSGSGGTRFAVVRYGNVVGSRGSVIPLFQRLINEGATRLPITDSNMTRFWITLSQGVDFVVANLDRMIGGELFVPKIPSMRMIDLAHAMAPDAQIDVVGIRPGEKLHEVMVPRADGRLTLEFDDYYVIEPAFQFWSRETYQERHGGTPVPQDFEYASDTNAEWLTAGELADAISA